MSKVLTGSKASLKLDGVKIAFVGGVNVNQENQLQPIEVLDQLEVAEHAEVGHSVSFSATIFKVDENATRALGLEFDDIDDIMRQGEMDMEIYDRIGDKVVYTVSGVKFQGGSLSIDARGVATGTFNFVGRIGRGL